MRRSLLTSKYRWLERLDAYLGEDVAFWFRLLNRTSRLADCGKAGALYRWQTPGCRTQNEDAGKWSEGLHHAACENLTFLEEAGTRPTSGQCESLMRLYEGLYLQAKRRGDTPLAATSTELAAAWLRRSLAEGNRSRSLWARRVLGFRLFHQIRSCVRSQS